MELGKTQFLNIKNSQLSHSLLALPLLALGVNFCHTLRPVDVGGGSGVL